MLKKLTEPTVDHVTDHLPVGCCHPHATVSTCLGMHSSTGPRWKTSTIMVDARPQPTRGCGETQALAPPQTNGSILSRPPGIPHPPTCTGLERKEHKRTRGKSPCHPQWGPTQHNAPDMQSSSSAMKHRGASHGRPAAPQAKQQGTCTKAAVLWC